MPLLLVLTLVLLPLQAPLAGAAPAFDPPDMPGEAAVIEAARALEEDVRQEGFHAVFRWVDDRQMVDRLLAAPSLPAEFEEEVRRDVRAEELFAFLYDDVGEFGSFDFLGTVRHGDHVRARFRAVNSNLGVTYHDFEFSHDPKRALRISDSRQMMADSDLVDYLGTFFELLESFDPDDDDARRVAEYLAAGSDIDEYASGDLPPFPADAITERNALILHLLQLKAAADLSVEALEIAIDALAERFPNHPSLPHRRLELAILQGDRHAPTSKPSTAPRSRRSPATSGSRLPRAPALPLALREGGGLVREMTDLPAAFRDRLAESAAIPQLTEVRRQRATDRTIKVLFRLPSGRDVESVLIPDLDEDGTAKRLTVCVSSQVGCAMGCHFCATGRMGFHQNLTAGEIFDQVRLLDGLAHEEFGRGVTNVVYMGMGEPLQNYGPVIQSTRLLTDPEGLGLAARRITVSTVGLARRIRQLADDQAEGRAPAVGLAISLHAPTDPQRSAIMPVNRSEKTDLGALEEAVRHFTPHRAARDLRVLRVRGGQRLGGGRPNLAAVTRWAPSKVNLIVYNPVPGAPFRSPGEAGLQRFIRALVARG
jgi:23S rRNA (adenine2503-C2)-methyltransferase